MKPQHALATTLVLSTTLGLVSVTYGKRSHLNLRVSGTLSTRTGLGGVALESWKTRGSMTLQRECWEVSHRGRKKPNPSRIIEPGLLRDTVSATGPGT